MPLYDYRCDPCDREFEDMRPMAERHTTECGECGGEAQMVIRKLPVIDPNADLPTARADWRKRAEERGRGKDMTAANRRVDDEATLRSAHQERARRGENPIIVS